MPARSYSRWWETIGGAPKLSRSSQLCSDVAKPPPNYPPWNGVPLRSGCVRAELVCNALEENVRRWRVHGETRFVGA